MSQVEHDFIGLEEGSPCPELGCAGVMDCAPVYGCSCHISAPCLACVDAGYICNKCGLDTTPDRPEPEVWKPKPRQVGRNQTTTTYTSSPFNSTPFTRCCSVAAINRERCPQCDALITWHDDGLAERRRKVGPGNCLMCGKKLGPLGVAGNCCC